MVRDYKQALAKLYPPVSYNINGERFLVQCEVDGNAFERLEQRAIDVLNVITPETSGQMLADWERVCGIQPDLTLTLEQRTNKVILVLNAMGGLSLPYFINIAESIGYQIDIKEFSPAESDLPHHLVAQQFDHHIDDLIFMWRVTVLNGNANITHFYAGESLAGDRLTDFGDPIIEEFIQDLKPAHTYCYFAYPIESTEE